MNVLGTWTSKGLPRPSWSNARGDVRIDLVKSSLSFVCDVFLARIVLTYFVNGVDRIFRQIRLGVEAEM